MRLLSGILLFCSTLFAITTEVSSTQVSNQALEKVSLQLHWKYQFEFAGFIAAKEKGFYEEVGLDVSLKEYTRDLNVVDEVVSRRSNFGIYNSNILHDYLEGKPLVLVASFFKRSGVVLLTKPSINSVEDLAGKTILSNKKEDFDVNFKALFDRYDINTSLLHFQTHNYSIEEFLDPQVDAMTAFISDQPYLLDKMGVQYNIINPNDFGTFNLQLELFTSEHEVLHHSLRVQKFREATIKGWEYALQHPKEISEVIHTKYAQNKSIEELEHEAQDIVKLILPYTYSIGYIDINFLQKQLEIFKKADPSLDATKTIEPFLFHLKANTLKPEFSKEEHLYIKANRGIDVCVEENQFPYDGYKNETHTGIMSDIFKEISKKTLLEFQVVPCYSKEELERRVARHECDMVSLLPTTSSHFVDIEATRSFAKTPFTLITKLDKSFVQSVEQLRSKTLVTPNKVYQEYLTRLYPYLTVLVEEDTNAMMRLLLEDKVYAVVDLDEKADYLVNEYGYGKLKINGFLAKDKPLHLSIGIQKSEAILYSIINKTLSEIPEEKVEQIFHSWRLTRYQSQTDYLLIAKLFGIFLLLVLMLLYYQRKLKRFNVELKNQVEEKTKELRKINQSLERSVAEKVQEIIQKDKLLTAQSKQAVMGEMISMIAHQWRQPLSTITLQISNLQIKRMMEEELDDAYIEKTLSQISDTIIYLSETVDDFQTYFRPDKQTTKVEIHELLSKAVNFVQPRLKDKKVTILINKDEDIYLNIYANELTQVILNILNNSIDALDDVKKVDKMISINVNSVANKIQIGLEDNGPGILPEYQEKLFEPYFSTKGKNGTGLGLYMSQMIIEKQFNGKIEAYNTEDGCIFVVTIDKELNSF